MNKPSIPTSYQNDLFYLFKSPLLWGELTRFLRGKKSFLTLLLFLSGLLFLVGQNWAGFASHWAPDQDIALGSRELFLSLAFGHLLMITLVTPFLMAPEISEERENDTLELLFSSPISVPHILFAKMISPLMFMFILLISAAPVLSLCFLGGGLDTTEAARTYLILLTAMLTYGCLGIFCSTLRSRVYEVYLVAAGMLLFFTFLLPYHGSIWKYLDTFQWYDDTYYNHGLQYLSPFFALRNEFAPHPTLRGLTSWVPDIVHLVWHGEGQYLSYTTGAYLVSSLGLCALFLWGAAWQIHRLSLGIELTAAQQRQFSLFLKAGLVLLLVGLLVLWIRVLMNLQPLQAVLFIIGTLSLAAAVYFIASAFGLFHQEEAAVAHERQDDFSFDVISAEGNPGVMLEQRVQWFSRVTTLVRLSYLSLMLSILTLPLASYNGSWLFLTLPFVSAALFTLPLSATSISSDRERGLLDLLRTTLLSSKQIIDAKFYTNLQYSLYIALALYLPGMLLQIVCSLLGYEVDLFTNLNSGLALLIYPVVLFVSLLLYTAFGLYCSALTGRTNRSLALSGSLIFITLTAPFLIHVPGLTQQSLWAYLASLGLALLSPLAGVASLFPDDNISLPARALIFSNNNELFFPLLFVVTQCVLCILGTFIFLELAQKKLESVD